MSPFGLVIISAAIFIALYFLTGKLFNETKKKEVILWTGLVLFLFIGFFSIYASNNMKFACIKNEYPIDKVVHFPRSIWNSEFYSITYHDEILKNLPDTIRTKKVDDVAVTDQEEKLALCEYRFLFLKEEKYVYYRNADEKNHE